MSENKKFTDEELKKVQTLRERMSKLVANYGELKLEQLLQEKKAANIETVEVQLNAEYENIQATELQLVKLFNEKYGRGTLDLDSGTFTPEV